MSEPCPVNLAMHPYFNLGGHASGDILAHQVHINASHYTPTDATSIPTGEISPVEGTPFDFRSSGLQAHSIGDRISALKNLEGAGGGYDHNYVLAGVSACKLALAATVVEPQSGRRMDLFTNAPGCQFYSGNYLGASEEGAGMDALPVQGKQGAEYGHRAGFCLE